MAKEETKTVSKDLSASFSLKTLSPHQKTMVVLRVLAIFGLVALLVAILIYGSFSVLTVFPEFMLVKTSNDLLNTLIQVDGIVLGFSGIVFAQLLSSVMDQQNILYQRIIEKPEEASSKAELLEYFERRKITLSYSTLLTFLFLILSIYASMAGIAKISTLKFEDTYSTIATLWIPLLFGLVAMTFLAFSLTGLSLKPPLGNSKKRRSLKKSS
jgi:hypothetical protein